MTRGLLATAWIATVLWVSACALGIATPRPRPQPVATVQYCFYKPWGLFRPCSEFERGGNT